MTFTQLYLLPSSFSLSEQLEILKEQVDEDRRLIFGSADFSVINGDLTENSISPLAIEQVRQLQVSVLQAPLQHQFRLIFIPQIELASIPAQNALLKLLEEPPAHVQFLLTTNQLSAVLETVQSRSQLIQLTGQKSSGDEFLLPKEIEELLQSFPAKQLSIAEVFRLSDDYKERPQALLLLQAVANFLHHRLRHHPSPKILVQLKAVMEATRQLESNVNTRFVVEEFFFLFVADKKE